MHKSRGFSLVELTMSLAVFLLLVSSVFTVLGKYQKSYQGEQVAADLHQGVRSAMELISQEVGQAGYFGFASRQLPAAVAGDANAKWVALSSTDSIFVGERLLVDAGAAQELVTVTGVDGSTVKGVFLKDHAINAPVNALGAFSQGVLPTSTATRLQIFGDINADGRLVYVEYNLDLNAGTLTRSITPITAAAQNPPRVLVRNLVANPGGTDCFQYQVRQNAGVVYRTEVWVTLSTQSTIKDPETKQYRTMASSLVVHRRADRSRSRSSPRSASPSGAHDERVQPK